MEENKEINETNDSSLPVNEVTKEETDKIIRNHMYSAFGLGLVPLPLVDVAAITLVQMNLARKLAKLYGVPFSKEVTKNIITSLVGSSIPVGVGIPLISIAKLIPVIGYNVSAITISTTAAASTYAIGHVFNRHFASGGSFLTFDTERVKNYYARMFKKGKEEASDMKKNDKTDNGVKNDGKLKGASTPA
jgi:uncharacterized protein (DUF697 family)